MVKRARFETWGKPSAVVELVDVDLPPPGPGEVVVDILAAPINPADILKCYGRYGWGETVPPLPSWGGVEGAGTVAEVGEGVQHLKPGTLVAMARVPGMWSERVVAPANGVIPLPAGTDPEQAAMLSVNPPTAWMMLEDHVDLAPGDRVIQNAANSAVGRHVIAFAKARGIGSVNVVRSDEAAAELRDAGAEQVAVDGPDLAERVAALPGGPIRLAIDAVGGASTARIATCLAADGKVVCYGLLSGEDPRLPAQLSIFHGVSMEGFWLPTGLRKRDRKGIADLYGRLAGMVADGTLHAPVAARYPLRDIAAALDHAERGGRGGKVLVTPQA